MKYKVISSIGKDKEFMNGIEFEQEFSNEIIGSEVFVLGGKFNISQNGKILVLTNKDWVLTIMKEELTSQETKETLEVLEVLEVNKDYEIFFETKTIQIKNTTLIQNGITYKDFFEAIEKEWKNIQRLTTFHFPLKFNYDFNQLIFLDGWSWGGNDFSLLRQGSWGRETTDGRSF